jgi:hypothetical protein
VNALRLLTIGLLALVPVAAAKAPTVEARASADCTQTYTGLVPLTDMGRRKYRGQPGGLYPGGLNRPSQAYLKRGLQAAKRIRPVNGRIVVLSIGISNATQEFVAFTKLAAADPQVAKNVKLVDGAIGGWYARSVARPGAGYWGAVDKRLRATGASPSEVQAVWLKEAISGEDRQFPQDAKGLRTNLRAIVQILTQRFRNLRIVYTSSRTYGGYAITSVNPEPAAYDSAYAVRWLIQDRMQNKLAGPWIAWGPYLWTDGLRGRFDGLTWACDDVRDDGTHPSPAGEQKVARLLLRFFKTDPTAKGWFAPGS